MTNGEWVTCPTDGGKLYHDRQTDSEHCIEVYCHKCYGKYEFTRHADGSLTHIVTRQPTKGKSYFPTNHK